MLDPFNKLHPHHNLFIPAKILEQLDPSSRSYRYFNGQETYSSNLLSRFLVLKDMAKTLDELSLFYPFHQTIVEAHKSYKTDVSNANQSGMLISAGLMFSIWQLGRRGQVLPFFNQYGKYFKTHRLFRQYVYSAIVPTAVLRVLVDLRHLDETQNLWAIHARRMQNKILQDPEGTRLPSQLLPTNLKTAWKTPYITSSDLVTKLNNETEIANAPDYVNPEFEAVDVPEAELGQDAQQEDDQ